MIATAISARELAGTNIAQTENVGNGFFPLIFLTILLGAAVLALLYYIWWSKEQGCGRKKSRGEDGMGALLQLLMKSVIEKEDFDCEELEEEDSVLDEKEQDKPCDQKPCLCFNECLFQETPYSDSGMTRQTPELEISGHSFQFQKLEQRDLYTIGRANSSDIQILYNMSISRQHARIERIPGQGFKISLATPDNVIYRCNHSFEVIEPVTEYIFKEGTSYFLLGEPSSGFRIALRNCKDTVPAKTDKNTACEPEASTKNLSGRKNRWAV